MRKDGDAMIINHGSTTYDSIIIDSILDKAIEERNSAERDYLSMFARAAYDLFLNIRNLFTEKKCKKISIETLRVRLDEEILNKYLKINLIITNYIIDFVEKNLKIT